MARYIDADKLIETNRVLLEHAQMNGMYNHARIYERFVHSIEEAPTADVAPKSEVERLYYNLQAVLEERAETKQEVARELLSDLKKAVHDKAVYSYSKEMYPYINLKVFDAIIADYLKRLEEKKYG